MPGYGKGHSKLNPKAKEFIPNGMQLIAPLLTTSASTSEKYKTSTPELGGTPQGNPPNSWADVVRSDPPPKKTTASICYATHSTPSDAKRINAKKRFWNRNNSPNMIADSLGDIYINDLYPTSSNSGRFSNEKTNRESLISAGQRLPNHATTLGIKVEDLSGYNPNNPESKKTALGSYIFQHNFASSKPFINNPKINNDRNIYTRHPYPEEGDYETPRNDSEIAALQKLTNLVDPLRTLKALNDKKYMYDGFNSDRENFHKSKLYEIITKSKKNSRIKIYMQNSRWFPCNEEWDDIKGGGDRSGQWCHNYLDQTIEYLNKNYRDRDF